MPAAPPPLPPPSPVEPFRLSDTPRTGGISNVPGPGEMAGLIRGLRQDIVLLREHLPIVPPAGPSVMPTTVPPPSKRQVAGKAAAGTVKWVFIANGALGFAVQLAAQFKPGLVGPLQLLGQFLGQLLGGGS
jgi:hypothetical protein